MNLSGWWAVVAGRSREAGAVGAKRGGGAGGLSRPSGAQSPCAIVLLLSVGGPCEEKAPFVSLSLPK